MMEQNETATLSEINNKPNEPFRHPNGLTDEQIQQLLYTLQNRKRDPEYLKRWEEGVAEYRRQIQEELERELAEEGK